jgi:cytochrome c oxidase assembly factor CtaG
LTPANVALGTTPVVTGTGLIGHTELHHAFSPGPGAAVLDVVLWMAIAVGAAAYTRGWFRLRSTARLASVRHLAAYLSAVGLMAAALVGPLDRAADRGLAPHMVQHMILVMAVPPLLLASRPYAIGIWGLPDRPRRSAARLLAERGTVRRLLAPVSPVVAFGLTALVHVVWHDPGLYDLAIRNPSVHAFQHATFVGSALAWWWHGLRAPPRLHACLSPGFRMVYLMGMGPVAMVIGMFIAFAPQPLYAAYAAEAARHGTDALADQQLGGAILWIMGGMMYLLAGLAGLAQDLSREERRNRASERPRPSAAAIPIPVRGAGG